MKKLITILFLTTVLNTIYAEDKPGETKLMKALKARHQAKQ